MSGWARPTKRPTVTFDLDAIALSDANAINTPASHSAKFMISSEEISPWSHDCRISDLAAGLPAPSKLRFKLFTLDHRLVKGRIGSLAAADDETVRNRLTTLLGGARKVPWPEL